MAARDAPELRARLAATEENHYLATPPAIARTLPRPAQELLGYAAHDALHQGGGYLGALDLRDPRCCRRTLWSSGGFKDADSHLAPRGCRPIRIR
jgi:hypothetical protein